jgi:hypothetical protein
MSVLFVTDYCVADSALQQTRTQPYLAELHCMNTITSNTTAIQATATATRTLSVANAPNYIIIIY